MSHPVVSLQNGNWFKLICGASFQHLPAVRSLVLAYTLAGADCIDVAADPAVIASAKEAIAVAQRLWPQANNRINLGHSLPWLMVSLNDGEDPHFRKAEFQADQCPSHCSRPCEAVCPADAIVFSSLVDTYSGVIADRCYGCGRCIPVCPVQHITARSYVSTSTAIAPLIAQEIDAIEIHTQIGRFADFSRLWSAIVPHIDQLKLIAISCPDGEDVLDYLWALSDLISPLPCPVIWQTDGRPMSGDIGNGTTLAAIHFGIKLLKSGIPGYIQLAGGTNGYTVTKLKELGLISNQGGDRNLPSSQAQISGVAYGSYARHLLSPVLYQLERDIDPSINQAVGLAASSPNQLESFANQRQTQSTSQSAFHQKLLVRLEDAPELLWQAVDLAYSLVSQLKPAIDHKTVASSH